MKKIEKGAVLSRVEGNMFSTSFAIAPSSFGDLFSSSDPLEHFPLTQPHETTPLVHKMDEKKIIRSEVATEVSLIVESITQSMEKSGAALSRKNKILRILKCFPRKEDWYNEDTKVKQRNRKVKFSSWKCYTESFLKCFVALMKAIVSDKTIGWCMEKYTLSEARGKCEDEWISSPDEEGFIPNAKRENGVKMPKDRQCYVCRCRFVSSTGRKKHKLDPGFSKYLGVNKCKIHGVTTVACLACACLHWLNGIAIEPNKVTKSNMPMVKCRQKSCKGDGWSIFDLEYMLVKRKGDNGASPERKRIKTSGSDLSE